MTDEADRSWVFAQDPATIEVRVFEDGTYAAVKRLLYHFTMIYGVIGDHFGYDDRWCYETLPDALKALAEWNYPEQKEPTGWHRNPRTSRRRWGGNPELEYIEP